MSKLCFVVFSEQEEFSDTISKQLDATEHARVAEIVSDPDQLGEAIQAHRADALFADLGVDAEGLLELIEALPAPRPLLLVAGPQEESQLILRAMRLGAREFFPRAPEEAELRSAVDRLELEHRPSVGSAHRNAPIIAVMGTKGGVGATVVACQLAASLQHLGGRTAVVDLNLPLGDVALNFDIQPLYTLANVARETERIDATSLRTILQSHSTGVQILAAPTRVEDAELVRGHHVERTLSILQSEFDWVIIDVSRSWSEASVRALDLADQILLVTLLDVPTLNHARAHLDLLKRLGHLESKIRLVANRYSKSDAVTDRDLAEFLGRPADSCIPNDYRTTLDSLNQGKPIVEIAPRSPIQAAYARLGEELHSWCEVTPQEGEASGKRVSRLHRIFGKRHHGTD